jgi:hypothetical protein
MPNGYIAVMNVGGRDGAHKYLHQIIVEDAIGRELKNSEEIHHVDGDRSNNLKENLVLCPSRAYHMLLHVRQRAYEATNDANAVKCEICGNYGADKKRKNRNSGWHTECKKEYSRNNYARSKK